MDAETSKAVKLHYQSIAPRVLELARVFYAELFRVAPGVRRLFPEDMTRQEAHLTAAIAIVARNINSLDDLEQPLSEMGARHAAYGAAPEHYPVVRDCLLHAMASISGPAWTPTLNDAWFNALNSVAAAMLRGAARAQIEVVRGQAASRRQSTR